MRNERMKKTGEAGFTIVELLVAVGLAVLLVAVVTMAFQVAFSTVDTVQRKLDLYESARGSLMELSMKFKPVGCDLLGQDFIIKSAAWQDTDPSTPEDTSKAGTMMLAKTASPAGGSMDATKYMYSRREADCIAYTTSLMSSTGCGADVTMPFVAMAPYSLSMKIDRIRHSLLGLSSSQLTDARKNVKTMTIGGQGYDCVMSYGSLWRSYTDPATGVPVANPPGKEFGYQYYQVEEHMMRPGREYTGTSFSFGPSRSLADLTSMDFNVAFWHDGLNRFVDLPDYTVMAFAPLPKALKFTITIWDREGRDYEVFSQVTWMPTGVGGVQPVSGAASYGPGGKPWVATDVDTKAYADADNDWAYSASVGGSCYFNRLKQMVGDSTWDYAVNWNMINYYNDRPTTW